MNPNEEIPKSAAADNEVPKKGPMVIHTFKNGQPNAGIDAVYYSAQKSQPARFTIIADEEKVDEVIGLIRTQLKEGVNLVIDEPIDGGDAVQYRMPDAFPQKQTPLISKAGAGLDAWVITPYRLSKSSLAKKVALAAVLSSAKEAAAGECLDEYLNGRGALAKRLKPIPHKPWYRQGKKNKYRCKLKTKFRCYRIY